MRFFAQFWAVVAAGVLAACATPTLGLDPGPLGINGSWSVDPEKSLEATFESQHQSFQALPPDRKTDLIRTFPVFLQLTFTDAGDWKGVFRQKEKEERGEGRYRILFRSASEIRLSVEEDAKPPREIQIEIKNGVLLMRFADEPKAVFALQKADIPSTAPDQGH